MNNKISIIIPALNEEAQIGKLLEYVLANSSPKNISEIIVIDGGSSDGTQNTVKAFINFHKTKNKKVFYYINNPISETQTRILHHSKTNILLLESKKGRAKQMNFGAKKSSGDILYFLHADSFPQNSFDRLIIKEVQKENLAGCFRMQFRSNHWWLRLASWLTKFNWRACRGGDQSQFISKDLFNKIGGFDERYIIYEDNILINELYNRNQFVVINKKINTSARLYKKHGVWKLQYFYWRIYLKKWMGDDANALYDYYKSKIY